MHTAMVRGLAVAVAACGFVVAAATAASAWTAWTTADLNVRQGPGVRYAVIFTLPARSQVEVGGCEPRWCWIDLGGATGWVSASYLRQTYVAPRPRPWPRWRPLPWPRKPIEVFPN